MYTVTPSVPVRHTVGSQKAQEKEIRKSNATSFPLTLSLECNHNSFLEFSASGYTHQVDNS